MRFVFREAAGIELPAPFPVLTYDEAMRDYGSDKPDLRVPLKLAELTDAVKDVDFKVFSGPANAPGGRVCALRVPGGGALTRGEIDAYAEYAKGLGAKGLAWIKVNERAKGAEGLQSPIVKNLHARALAAILRADRGAGRRCDLLRRRRGECGRRLHGRAAPEGRPRARPGRKSLAAAVGGGFPDVRARRGREEWKARHHPFTSPKDGHEQYIDSAPGKAYAKAYDVVLNGWELGGGSVRIHRPEVQTKVFEAHENQPRKSSAPSSASCSTRCNTARRRTAASLSASTAWSR